MRPLLFKVFFSLFFFGKADCAQREPLAELIRPLAYQDQSSPSFPITLLHYQGTYTESYVYTDLMAKMISNGAIEKMVHFVRHFDQEVYPEYIRQFGLEEMGRYHRKNKIAIIFDENLEYEAYHSHILRHRYNRDFILVNLGSSLHHNDLRYHFPHELQHIIRFHFSPHEADWLNEGLSVFATYYLTNEFPEAYLKNHRHLLSLPLLKSFESSSNSSSYFNSFFYVYYLYQHYGGIDLIRELMKSSLTGFENVNASLKKIPLNASKRTKKPDSRSTFVNYQMALALNPYRDKLLSDGFFDLMLSDEGIPAQLVSYGSDPVRPQNNQLMKLVPNSSGYFILEHQCYSVRDYSKGKILMLLIDIYTKNDMDVIRIMKSNKKYCLEDVRNHGQYILLINPEGTEAASYIFSITDQ